MIIRSKNFVLKLEEILKDESLTERYNEHENFVLKIIRKWCSNATFFTHQTSGSTGRPKNIEISREQIEISSRATMNFIDPEGQIKTSLLCLSPLHIGGAMVIYRALIFSHDLTIVEPGSKVFEGFDSESFDLVSMVPLQFKALSPAQLNQFSVVLIGGAPIEVTQSVSTAKVYSTFGMTETVSHVALRLIDEDIFRTTGDTEVDINEAQQLMIRGAITNNKWMVTNDLAEIRSKTEFLWIGRNDFVINTGGIKVNPEIVEQKLSDQMTGDYIITSLPDERLGNKVILISSEPKQSIDFGKLSKYERPKSLYFDRKIFKTTNGKLDRIITTNELINSL